MSPLCDDETTVLPQSPRRRPLYYLISLPLAAILLYLSLRGVDWLLASSANPALILTACFFNLLGYFTRALRWRVLLSAGGKIRMSTVFWSNSAGYMANNFLPARPGEILRSGMIAARSSLSKTYVLTTAISGAAWI